MYQDYLSKHDPEYVELDEENQKRRVAHQLLLGLRKPLHFYHDLFESEFNIHFGYPRTDSCAKCDALQLPIIAHTSSEEKEKLEAELQEHQEFAKAGFRYDQDLSRKSSIQPSMLVFTSNVCLFY